MSDNTTQNASDSTPWWNGTVAHAVEGAVAGTLAMPFLGPLAPILGGVAGAEAGDIFKGLFGDDSKPAEAKKGVAQKAEEVKKAAEPAPAPAPPAQNASDTAPGQKVMTEKEAEAKIDASYGNNKLRKPLANESLAGLDKMSKEDRLKLLNGLTQQDPSNADDAEHMCGPTALIAAAMYGGGTDGLKTLMTKIAADSGKESAEAEHMQGLMEKMKNGELGTKDLEMLKGDLYKDLQARQLKNAQDDMKSKGMDPSFAQTDKGTQVDTMSQFIKDSGMGKLFFDDKGQKIMNLDLIANAKNSDVMGHYVLQMNNQENGGPLVKGQDGNGYNAVYDPYAKQNGKQVVTSDKDAALMQAYTNTLTGTDFYHRVDVQR